MAKFLTTKGVAAKIEEIIRGAKKKVVIVSPYLQVSDSFFQRLKDADSSGITVYIVYGKNDLSDQQWHKLSQLKSLKLFFIENLHAKCYFNEIEMVITSMNFYEFSELNNIEMGISISRRKDSTIYYDAISEVEAILKASEEQHEMKSSFSYTKTNTYRPFRKKAQKAPTSVCIRCKEEIPFDTDRPYCRSCYYIWADFENYDYLENYCHRCGKYEDTSMNRPLCSACYFS